MFHFLQSDIFRVAFRPQQLIESLNMLIWAQSFGKLLIHPLALCPLYFLTDVVEAYSIFCIYVICFTIFIFLQNGVSLGRVT